MENTRGSAYPKWILLFLGLTFVLVCAGELCPDQKRRCRTGQTCCDDKQGGFDCCPYGNATCCSDGLHCCPERTTCDLAAGRCLRNKKPKQMELIPAFSFDEPNELAEGGLFINEILYQFESKKVDCPDKKRSCPQNYTCCQDPEESYSCCPYANATCCADKIHCCPQGSRCDNGSCA